MASRKLNVRLLLTVLAVLAVLAVAVHVVHLVQVQRLSQNLLARAGRFEATGQTAQAVELLKRYLFFEPGDNATLARYGQQLDEAARSPADRLHVARVLGQVVQRDPGRQDIRRRLVEVLLALDLPFDARDHLELLIRGSPDDTVLQGLLAQALEASGETDEAIRSYETVLGRAPQQLDSAVRLANLLHRLDQADRAGRVLDEMVQANPRSARAHLERARFRIGHGAPGEAGDDLTRARELAPTDAAVLRVSAGWFQGQGQWDQARAVWEQGLKHHPRDETMYLGLANLELLRKRPAQAAACLREGLGKLPGEPELLFLLTEVQLRQGELDAAEETIGRLAQIPDRSVAVDYLRGRLLMWQKKWAEAIANLEKAAPLCGPALGGTAQVCLAACYAELDNPDRQLAAYQKGVQVDPNSVEARLGLASTLLAQNRLEQALEQFAVLAALPQPPDALWLPYGKALYQRNLARPRDQRDWAEVEKVAGRAAALQAEDAGAPALAEACVLRADVLLAQERPQEARAVLEQGLKDHPDQALVWLGRTRLAVFLQAQVDDLGARSRRARDQGTGTGPKGQPGAAPETAQRRRGVAAGDPVLRPVAQVPRGGTVAAPAARPGRVRAGRCLSRGAAAVGRAAGVCRRRGEVP
jgi:tetratricopeptide (TPR) repeat protein